MATKTWLRKRSNEQNNSSALAFKSVLKLCTYLSRHLKHNWGKSPKLCVVWERKTQMEDYLSFYSELNAAHKRHAGAKVILPFAKFSLKIWIHFFNWCLPRGCLRDCSRFLGFIHKELEGLPIRFFFPNFLVKKLFFSSFASQLPPTDRVSLCYLSEAPVWRYGRLLSRPGLLFWWLSKKMYRLRKRANNKFVKLTHESLCM